MRSKNKNRLTPGGIIVAGAISAPFGALAGGIFGSLGQYAVSFFNPAMASVAGSFATFAGIGAIAAPLIIIPRILLDHVLNRSAFLAQRPNFKEFIQDTTSLLLNLAVVATAAAIIGSPIGPTILCMMIIPAAIYLLSTLCRAINACLNNADEYEHEGQMSFAQ
jgi:hypothetical protein